MRVLTCALVLGSLPLAGLALRATQSQVKFGDRKDNFAIMNFRSQLVEGNITDGFSFTFSGTPLTGYSRSQGLEFSAQSLTGRAVSDKQGGLVLRNAKATGSVQVEITRVEASGTKIEGRINSNSLTLDDPGDRATITIPSNFTYRQTDTEKAGNRILTLTGGSGTVVVDTLKAVSKSPLRSANVVGPVKVTIKSTAVGKDKETTTDMVATGSRLTYDGATRTMVLSGNVEFDGSQNDATGAGFLGKMNADKLTVWFVDDKFEVKNFRLEGGPGSATVQETPPKKGGGGKR